MTTLYYFHDPMCSWCWAFRPTYDTLKTKLPDDIVIERVLTGLAPDNKEPMPEAMQHIIQNHWRTIEKTVPGTEFNYDFWKLCKPRRATYPACRAVIAAKRQDESFDEKMTNAIQQAYYLHARNPSDNETLIDLAVEIGLDKDRFTKDLTAKEIEMQLQAEISFSRKLQITAFPSLLLTDGQHYYPIKIDYNKPAFILDQIRESSSLN